MDANAFGRVVERDTTIGQKCPKINFPSGLAYEIVEHENKQVWVCRSGVFAVHFFSHRDCAFVYLKTLIASPEYIDCFVHPVEYDVIFHLG